MFTAALLAYRGWSVRRLLILLALAALPLLAFEIISVVDLRLDRELEVREEAKRLLDLVEAEQQRLVDDIRHVLLAITELGLGQLDTPTCLATLDRIKKGYPSYLAINAADKIGTIWCSTEPSALGLSVRDRPYRWEALGANETITGQVILSRTTGRPAIPFARAYRGKDGTPAGSVAVLLDTIWLESYLAQKSLPASSAVLIADKAGTILARVPAIPGLPGQHVPAALQTLLSAKAKGVVELPGADGVPRIIAFSPAVAGVPDLYIQVSLDKHAAMRAINAGALRSVLVFCALLVISSIGAAWAVRRLLRLRDQAQRSALKTASVLASTVDGVIELDREWRFTYLNDRAKSLIAQGRNLLGLRLWDAFPELAETPLWEQAHRAMTDQVSVDVEFHGHRTDRWFWARGFPSSTGLAVYLLDITQRRQGEEALRRSEERLTIALAGAEAGIWDYDVSSGTLTWSEAMYPLFGVSPDRFTPTMTSFYDLIHPDDRETVNAFTQEMYKLNRSDYRVEFRITHPTLGQRWIMGIGRVVYGDGHPLRVSGLNIDITARKTVEQALRDAKAKADEANVSKSKFLAAASHDLRQPLQSALLFSGVLHRYVNDERGRSPLTSLERALDTLKNLLDSLLDVSRLDAGVIVPQIADVPLGALLDEIDAAYAPIAASKGLEFQVETLCTMVAVHSDRVLLGRMLRNLVENAVRYTERGYVRVHCEPTRNGICIKVQDSGIGIPPEHLTRVFEEFHQVGNPERDRSQGLGLGLAIVQRLSWLLHHPIAVHSVPGEGSVFSIEVPHATTVAELPPQPERLAEPSGEGRLVFLIDDDVIVLTGLQTIFQEWGYDVIIAGSTEQALERLRMLPRSPDLVVADYRLRDQKVGTEAIVKIRERVGRPIPGIILTGEIGSECERDAATHGLAIVHKPITPRQLHNTVQNMLGPTAH